MSNEKMDTLNVQSNRLGIFVFYDVDGIVDNYIPYLLKDMVDVVKRLIIICNGKLGISGKEVLSQYTDEIIIRENDGYDGGAYKHVFTEYLDKGSIDEYDEIVLFNDTFYGPFYPLEEVFKDMQQKSCDFWGLSIHGCFLAYDRINSLHVQSYFLVLRNSVIRSDVFRSFWNKMQMAQDFDSAVINYEISLSETLIKAGFIPDAYLRMDRYITEDPKRNLDYCQLKSGEAIACLKLPILKRKSFINQNGIYDNHELKVALNYIYKEYDYPFDYILHTLFRKEELGNIYKSFGLNMEFMGRKNEFARQLRFLIVIHDAEGEVMEDIGESINRISRGDFFVDISIVKDNPILYIKARLESMEEWDYICIIQDEEWIGSEHRMNRLRWRDDHFSSSLLKEEIKDYLAEVSIHQQTLGIMIPQLSPKDLSVKIPGTLDVYNRVRDFLEINGVEFRCTEPENIVFSFKSFWCETVLLRQMIKYYYAEQHNAWFEALPYLAQSLGRGMSYISGHKEPSEYANMFEKAMRSFLSINR